MNKAEKLLEMLKQGKVLPLTISRFKEGLIKNLSLDKKIMTRAKIVDYGVESFLINMNDGGQLEVIFTIDSPKSVVLVREHKFSDQADELIPRIKNFVRSKTNYKFRLEL